MGEERLLKAVVVNNPVSFTPSLRHLRCRRSSVHGTGLFPGFYLALFCKVPLPAFLALRFLGSLSKENKNNVSLFVTRSLVADPSCAPWQSLRSGLLLAPSFLRSAHYFCSQESIITGGEVPISATLPHTVTFCRSPVPPRVPARLHLRSAPPPVGPPSLGLPGPLSAFSPSPCKGTSNVFSLHRFTETLPGPLIVAFQPNRKRATFAAVSHPAFSRHVKAGTKWPQTAPGSLRPCRPPSPQTPHPPPTLR